MTMTELTRECLVDVALRWGTGYDAKVLSFVNIIATPKGGTHVQGFDQALVKMFRKQLELNARRLKVGSDKVEKEDILAGLTAVVTVRLAEPQFEGQTKEVLGTSAVRAIVAAGRRAGAHRPITTRPAAGSWRRPTCSRRSSRR